MSQQSVLVTGGTGTLGQALTPQLRQAGYTLRVMSRRDAPAGITVEWARASLETGEGLDTAVAGTEVIIHAASSSTRRAQQVDVVGTERLLAAAHRAGVGHFIYISIVGIEQVPFPYYRYKLAAEKLVEAGGGPEVQTLGEMARLWRQVRGLRRPVVHLPLWGKAAAGFRKGHHTTPGRKVGRITWAEWLQRQYQAKAIDEKHSGMQNS